MPHVTIQFSTGRPLLDLFVGVSRPREEALKKAQQPVPARVPIRGLIDTGASTTCIHSSVLKALGLTPKGTTQMHTGTTGAAAHVCNEYDVSLFVPVATGGITIPIIAV